MGTLSTLDLVIFFGSLIAVMAIGLWAGRKEETSEDYFLAGRQTRWWGVAGSIFGSNVSANHMVGMMGLGYVVGFAQSQFEITAIVGLLLLCYGFLPVYRKLNIYTLSEYLEKRYDDKSRIAYALIMIIIMVAIQTVPGFYFGSRAVNRLLGSGVNARAKVKLDGADQGKVTEILISNPGRGYDSVPTVIVKAADAESDKKVVAVAVIKDGKISSIRITDSGEAFSADEKPMVVISGGASFNAKNNPADIDPTWYIVGILIMALVTGSYTIFGGLKAVIVTDVIQSVLMLVGGLLVAYLVFNLDEVGGWAGMLEADAAADAIQGSRGKMHLYEASNHPKLPWTGMFTGLMVLHFYYWGTNQFIVQRALSARSDREARLGIIIAGFFKLLIPFFSIGTGIAAYYLFKKRDMDVASDDVFTVLLNDVVSPVGAGLVGLVAAGLIGAILSSVDSMLNSASTIITIDFYKRYVNPEASEKRLVFLGRVWIAGLIIAATIITIFIMDPNSKESFFLYVAEHQMKLVSGLVVAFAVGMFWKRATAAGAIAAIVTAVILSYANAYVYNATLGTIPAVAAIFGQKLHFFHAAFLAAVVSLVVHIVVSLLTQPDEEKSRLTWTDLGGHNFNDLRNLAVLILISLGVIIAMGVATATHLLAPAVAGTIASIWVLGAYWRAAYKQVQKNKAAEKPDGPTNLILEDRFWAGILAALALFMMYYYY